MYNVNKHADSKTWHEPVLMNKYKLSEHACTQTDGRAGGLGTHVVQAVQHGRAPCPGAIGDRRRGDRGRAPTYKDGDKNSLLAGIQTPRTRRSLQRM